MEVGKGRKGVRASVLHKVCVSLSISGKRKEEVVRLDEPSPEGAGACAGRQ